MARPGRPVSQELEAEGGDLRNLLTIKERAMQNTRRTAEENRIIVARAAEIMTIYLRYHSEPPPRSPVRTRKTPPRVKKRAAATSNGADA